MPKINITRDGGLYIKPSDLLRDPKVQKKIVKFSKIIEKHFKEQEKKEKEK